MRKTATFISASMEQAVVLGTEPAVLMQHIAHWVAYNEANTVSAQFADGAYWAYFSHRSVTAYMPCFSPAQVKRIVKKLTDDGYLEVKARFDRLGTRLASWYKPTEKYYNIKGDYAPLDEIVHGGGTNIPTPPAEVLDEIVHTLDEIVSHNNINSIILSKDLIKEKEYTSYIPKSDEVTPNFVEVGEFQRSENLVSDPESANTNAGAVTILPPSPKPPSKAAALRNRQEYSLEFEHFWEQYPPNGASKSAANKSYASAVSKGALHQDILAGAGLYAGYARATGVLVAHATTWLNQSRWEIDYRKLYQEETNARNRFNRPTVVEQFVNLASGVEAQAIGDDGVNGGNNHGSSSDNGYRAPWATD